MSTAYCTQDDVEARVPSRGGATWYAPLTAVGAQSVLVGIAAEIDSVLAGAGYTVPVSTPAGLVSWLLTLNVWGAAAEVLRARFQDASGTNSEAAWKFFEDRYRAGLAALPTRAEGFAGTSSAEMPTSYTYANPAADNDLGTNAEPTLTMDMEW